MSLLSVRPSPPDESNIGGAYTQSTKNQSAQLVVAPFLGQVVHGKADGQIARPNYPREPQDAFRVCRLGIAQARDAKELGSAMRRKGGERAENEPARGHAEPEGVPCGRGD